MSNNHLSTGMILSALFLMAHAAGCGAYERLAIATSSTESAESDPVRRWEPVLEVDFSAPDVLDDWLLEGAAAVSITETGELLIENVTQQIGEQEVFRSTLWHRKPFWGDLKFELEVKGEQRGGNIFFFNAQPLRGHKSIFEWLRPQANYVDYTAEPRMHMYTLGMLRGHQEEINLRFLGGELAYLADASKADPKRSSDPDNRFDARARAEFARKTILYRAPSPFDASDKYYNIELTVVGNRIRLRVDDKEVMNFSDVDRTAEPLRGGYFAFRNFAMTRTWCRYLRVSRLSVGS